jgi:hypothetical protein
LFNEGFPVNTDSSSSNHSRIFDRLSNLGNSVLNLSLSLMVSKGLGADSILFTRVAGPVYTCCISFPCGNWLHAEGIYEDMLLRVDVRSLSIPKPAIPVFTLFCVCVPKVVLPLRERSSTGCVPKVFVPLRERSSTGCVPKVVLSLWERASTGCVPKVVLSLWERAPTEYSGRGSWLYRPGPYSRTQSICGEYKGRWSWARCGVLGLSCVSCGGLWFCAHSGDLCLWA